MSGMNYALIDNGIVTNVIYLSPSNASDFPAAVPVNSLPVQAGDTYEDGVFYRDGKPLTTGDAAMAEEMADMKEALALLGVTNDE